MMPSHASSLSALEGQKIAGYQLKAFLDGTSDSAWYDAQTDSGSRALVYAFQDRAARDASCRSIHGFITTADECFPSDPSRPIFIAVGQHRIMMSRELRERLTDPTTRPPEIGGFI